MTISLGTNIAAYSTIRRLGETSTQLYDVLERLSSGARINRASDDAAGLAVATQLKNQSNLYGVANRNINDAISMVSIGEAALGQQSEILMRLSELAEQAANGTLSSTQKESLNLEYQQLLLEMDRIGDSTSFNGISLLTGKRDQSSATATIQAGISGASIDQLSFTKADSASLSGTISNDNMTGDPIGLIGAGLSLEQITEHFNGGVLTFTADSGRELLLGFGIMGGGLFTAEFYLLEDDGSYAASTDTVLIGADPNTGEITAAFAEFSSSLEFAGEGDSVDLTLDLRGLRLLDEAASSAVRFTGVETTERATMALEVVGQRLDEISNIRGEYGAFSSRLAIAANLTLTNRENYQAASSRIVDADIAAESAALVSLQIRQQAATAVLAQANFQPELALTLLSDR